MNTIRPNLANLNQKFPNTIQKQVETDFHRFIGSGLPSPLEPYILQRFGLDVSTTYAGIPIKNPWGKASGQLSMTAQQVEDDAAAGLGFCVLKTVIAQDAIGQQAMAAWAIPESRMVLERITGRSGATGWTVSWRGRGWYRSFHDYLQLIRDAQRIARPAGMLVVPSCKYFLPTPGSPAWDTNEYAFSTQELLRAYNADGLSLHAEMPIEKDFSPTLAGSSFAADQKQIIDWLQRVPDLIRQSAAPNQVRVGLKMFNAMFDDAFQLHMLQSIALAGNARPDFIVYANRLFDPARNFEGQLGIAVGGPDLSDRNIRVLTQFQNWLRTYPELDRPEISATGDICSGRRAVEYLLRGCRNFQLHTFFQLPADQYPMRHGNKIARALHRLYFDPNEGFIVWALFAAERVGLDSSRPVRVMDLADIHRHGERLDALWAEIDSAIR